MFKKQNIIKMILIGIGLLALLLLYFTFYPKEILPIYNPSDINPLLVDKSLHTKNKNHKVSDFSLINQNGKTITQKDFDGKIYVADFFFTRCPTICPIMTNNMLRIQDAFITDNEVMLLSLSVTPNIDSISVLKKYAIENGVIDKKWHVTTGSKKHIYALARKSYLAVLDEGIGDKNDFIHTENFILIDKERRIRGMYDGTEKEDMQKIIDDIYLLKEEYSK